MYTTKRGPALRLLHLETGHISTNAVSAPCGVCYMLWGWWILPGGAEVGKVEPALEQGHKGRIWALLRRGRTFLTEYSMDKGPEVGDVLACSGAP